MLKDNWAFSCGLSEWTFGDSEVVVGFMSEV